MIEVKFKGKSKCSDRWMYGDLLRNEEGSFAIVPPFQLNSRNECSDFEVFEETICQFSGVCDKDGKEIYYGDILKHIGKHGEHIRHVAYHNGCFIMKSDEDEYYTTLDLHVKGGRIDWEVVGNIYDDNKLLED